MYMYLRPSLTFIHFGLIPQEVDPEQGHISSKRTPSFKIFFSRTAAWIEKLNASE